MLWEVRWLVLAEFFKQGRLFQTSFSIPQRPTNFLVGNQIELKTSCFLLGVVGIFDFFMSVFLCP